MHNLKHEIECPDDKYIKYFLWYDYFHDSIIEKVEFEDDKLNISIDCHRERGFDWNEHSTLWGLNNKDSYDKHIYHLHFEGCKYFHFERDASCHDYINGVFKDTALLQKTNLREGKSYYHFRMQFADGYMDIIFRKFKIRKEKGRIRINDLKVESELIYPKAELIQFAQSGDDEERYIALLNLTPTDAIDYARNVMNLDYKEYELSRTAAIWVIGKAGNKTDLDTLFHEYFSIEGQFTEQGYCFSGKLMAKRNVMDAIEMITYKAEME